MRRSSLRKMSSCHKQSAAYVANISDYAGPRRIHLEQASNWGNEGCVPWLQWKDPLNLGHPCCDVTGLQMQPSEDATPESGHSTSCRWWPLLLHLKLSVAQLSGRCSPCHAVANNHVSCWSDANATQQTTRLARRLILCERSLKTPEARILPEANVQKRSTWRRHRKIGSGKVWMLCTAKDLNYISWAQS